MAWNENRLAMLGAIKKALQEDKVTSRKIYGYEIINEGDLYVNVKPKTYEDHEIKKNNLK